MIEWAKEKVRAVFNGIKKKPKFLCYIGIGIAVILAIHSFELITWFENNTQINKDVKITDIVSAVVTCVIFFFGYQISKAQKNIAKEKLKLDLFDRRYLLYKNIKKYLGLALIGADIRFENPNGKKFYKKMFNCKQEAIFLFGRETSDELYNIYRKINDGFSWKNGLKDHRKKSYYGSAPDLIQRITKDMEEKIHLIDRELENYSNRVDELFTPYMSFEDLKIK